MAIYYFETSALLKRYRTEKGTDVLDELFQNRQGSEVFTTSYFTVLEVTSVATRLLKANNISRRSYYQILGDLSRDTRYLFVLQPVSDSTLSQALNLILDYGLRAPDAVQLATALVVRSNVPTEPVYFLCTDAKLRGACEGSDLAAIDPEAKDSLEILRRYRGGV